jgi:hypothetical protein
MNQDELRNYVAMVEIVLGVQEIQVVSEKVLLAELDMIASLISLRAQLNQLGDGAEATDLRARVESFERELPERRALLRKPLNDWLARVESNHEKSEALLAALKSALKPPPGAK